ncbi:MAG: hypothetical protein R3362_08465, partial [Rhodothermales bacterium]|nr:hypothetical protein [Rhodothermales bacterium]
MPRRTLAFFGRARERAASLSLSLPGLARHHDRGATERERLMQGIPTRDRLPIRIQPDGGVLVRDEPHSLTELPALVADFLRNPREEDDKPAAPARARVFIDADPQTPHRLLVAGLEAVRAGYLRLYNEQARALYGTTYSAICDLPPAER